MEKRSRRRIRDLVALAAFQGLSQNEIGCARISMMARSTNAPFKGRIQKHKTNHLQIFTFGLQRTAGPYKSANCDIWVAGRWAERLIYLKIVSETRSQLRFGRQDTSRQWGGEVCTGIYSFRQMGRS